MEIEQLKEVKTPEEMRAELFRLSHYDALVRQTLDFANYSGMSAEDKYTVLAYHAMSQRNQLQQMMLKYTMLDTKPAPIVMKR